ncbi:hypothetical protein SKAU_G00186810 [Synaphobranchus kaupii]|uniref:Uncharacterized protein n=1 Tax=Synaphobranchus kaupii TaxID=118154 RepID=A0A9Q1FCU5_SYNKA|nr:hypothetical protein SKAU_G00186810 [Synaphobranchus kaupii]
MVGPLESSCAGLPLTPKTFRCGPDIPSSSTSHPEGRCAWAFAHSLARSLSRRSSTATSRAPLNLQNGPSQSSRGRLHRHSHRGSGQEEAAGSGSVFGLAVPGCSGRAAVPRHVQKSA